CSPSRTSLLTGRRPDTTKVYDLETHFRTTIPDVITLPQQFKNAGYHSQGFGKIYHGALDDKDSWSVPHTPVPGPAYADPKILKGMEEQRKKLREEGLKQKQVNRRTKGPAWEAADVEDDKLSDGKTATNAIKAMNDVKDKPFFLAVGFVKPHLPFVAPKKYFDLYPLESIELPKDNQRPQGVPAYAVTDFGELRGYQGMPKDPAPVEPQQARELIRAYNASVSYIDAQVGRVVAELERLGLRANTIVVLWGDHGWHLGEQGQWTKHTNFENATRNALIVSVPSGHAKAGAKTDALVETVDLYPTLCELAGLPRPDGLEGTSLVPLFADPSRAWKPAAFSQYPREGGKVMGYSIRTDRYRYTEWQDAATKKPLATELYDHENDAAETVNLATKEDQAAVMKKLSEQLNAGWKRALPKS
ncbi:MAG: sulfatase, partial [Planctomycetota bacterium]|nr:sulfatase [Planctomycetota bacterium]